MQCWIWSKLSNFDTNFAAAKRPKSLAKIERHKPIDLFRSSETSPTLIRQVTNAIFFTSLMFSSVVDVLERPARSSWPSENSLYHR